MISTKSWASRVVANSFFSLVGMVVFLEMTVDMRPSLMRTPRECGVTSSSTTSSMSPLMMPHIEGVRGDVEQHHVLDVAADDAALGGGADRHDLVGVHVLGADLAEDRLDL